MNGRRAMSKRERQEWKQSVRREMSGETFCYSQRRLPRPYSKPQGLRIIKG